MEKRFSGIAENITRKAAVLAGALVLAGVLAGCGQTDPPTVEEFNDETQTFILDGATAANGEPVRCVMYGSETVALSDSKSWFGFDCDWEGTAVFDDEPQPAATTTTIG